jgi:hypothetical protein
LIKINSLVIIGERVTVSIVALTVIPVMDIIARAANGIDTASG